MLEFSPAASQTLGLCLLVPGLMGLYLTSEEGALVCGKGCWDAQAPWPLWGRVAGILRAGACPSSKALALTMTFVLDLKVHQQLRCLFTQKNKSIVSSMQFKS